MEYRLPRKHSKFHSRGRIFLVLAFFAVISVAAIIVVSQLKPRDDFGDQIREWRNKFVGMSEAQMIARFGPPKHTFEGHYGNPPLSFTSQHPAAKTLVFDVEGGTLYVSFEMEGSTSVCFCCDFLPHGSAF